MDQIYPRVFDMFPYIAVGQPSRKGIYMECLSPSSELFVHFEHFYVQNHPFFMLSQID